MLVGSRRNLALLTNPITCKHGSALYFRSLETFELDDDCIELLGIFGNITIKCLDISHNYEITLKSVPILKEMIKMDPRPLTCFSVGKSSSC